MKRQNLVILSGSVVSCEECSVELDGMSIPALQVLLETDHPAYGGHHKVIFPGRLAVEFLAFYNANGQRLEITVDGWLRSGKETCVVADRVMFHVNSEVREKAVMLIKQMLAGPKAR